MIRWIGVVLAFWVVGSQARDCRQSPRMHALDFWIGHWDVSQGGRLVRKFIQGVLYTVATGTHNAPPKTWFDVLIVRSSMVSPSGLATTIYVNDEPVVSLLQGELTDGRVGVVTHWSKGRFDDLSVTQFIVRHPR